MTEAVRLAWLAIIFSIVAVGGAVLGLPPPAVFMFAGAAVIARLAALKRGV